MSQIQKKRSDVSLRRLTFRTCFIMSSCSAKPAPNRSSRQCFQLMFVFSSAVRRWICSCRRWKASSLLRLQPTSRRSRSPGLRSAPSRHWGTRPAPEPRSRRERLRTANPGASGREGRTSRRFSAGLRSDLTPSLSFRSFVFYKLLADTFNCEYLQESVLLFDV